MARDRPSIEANPVDVTDAAAMARTAAGIAGAGGCIDLAIFNAGIGTVMDGETFDADLAAQVMAVNYLGLVNGIAAVLPAMRARQAGHIALISSLAGYRGIPRGAAYAPSKAAAISLAECLKPDLERFGISISIVNPGFVDTPMMAKAPHPLPFVMSADKASEQILAGLAARRFEIAFPWQMRSLLKLGRVLPYRLYFKLLPDPARPRR